MQINFNVLKSKGGLKNIKSLRSNNLLIITSPRYSDILKHLSDESRNIYNYQLIEYNYKSEPSVSILKNIINNLNFLPDKILAVGGGSVMDTAKSVKALFNENFPLRIGKKKNILLNSNVLDVELIVIPSILGSGSEVSSSSVIYDDKKIYLASRELIPNSIIYDTDLYETLSPYQKKFGLGDSIVHTIESCFSKLNNGFLEIEIKNSINLINNILVKIENKDEISIDDLINSSFWGGIYQDKFLVGPTHCIAHNLSKSINNYNHSEVISFLFPIVYNKIYNIRKNKKIIDCVFDSIGIDFLEFIKLFKKNISNISKIKEIKISNINDVINDSAGKYSNFKNDKLYDEFI